MVLALSSSTAGMSPEWDWTVHPLSITLHSFGLSLEDPYQVYSASTTDCSERQNSLNKTLWPCTGGRSASQNLKHLQKEKCRNEGHLSRILLEIWVFCFPFSRLQMTCSRRRRCSFTSTRSKDTLRSKFLKNVFQRITELLLSSIRWEHLHSHSIIFLNLYRYLIF